MKKLVQVSVLIASMMTTGVVLAATQGSVGGTSTGSVDINVTVDDAVRISGLSDLTATFDGVNDVVENSTACIYRNATGLYAVTATGDIGVSNTFIIDDAVNPAIPYTVTWNDGSGPTAMTSTVQLTGQTGADTTLSDCGGGSNATVEVTVDAAALLAAPTSVYTGTLTLEVAPE